MKGEGEIPSKLRGIPDFAWTSKEKKNNQEQHRNLIPRCELYLRAPDLQAGILTSISRVEELKRA